MPKLRTGLPVIKSYNTTTGFEHTTYAIKPEHLAHWAMAAVGDIGIKVQYKLVHVRYTPARRPTSHGAATRACIMHDPARGTSCIYATRSSSIATLFRPVSRNARNLVS